MAEGNVTLEYAKRPTWVRRRGLRATLIILLLGAIVAGAWYRHSIMWAARRGLMLHAQRQCLDFTTPPGRVVYEEDVTRASELLKQADYRPTTLTADGQRIGAVWWPAEIRNYPDASLWPKGTAGEEALLFLHERRTASGQTVLVCVKAWMDRRLRRVRFGSRAVTLATWNSDSQTVGGRGGGAFEISDYYERTPLRIYAGQPDPSDASRFTVEYELNGRRGILKGRVTDSNKPPGASNLTVDMELEYQRGDPTR